MRINYGYLRISTDKQDMEAQKHTILTYGNENNISEIMFIEDVISSAKKKESRKIFAILNEDARKGDTVLVSEVSRLGRNTLEVLELSKIAMERGIRLVIAKQNMIFDQSMQSKIYVTIMGLVAEIERDFIQQRTMAAMDQRRSVLKDKGYFMSRRGNKRYALGRYETGPRKLGLEDRKLEVYRLLHQGYNKTVVMNSLGVSRPTLMRFLERFPLPKQMDLIEMMRVDDELNEELNPQESQEVDPEVSGEAVS